MPAKAAPKKNKSAIKRSRQTEVRTLRSRSTKNMLKTLSKKVESEVAAKNGEGAKIVLKKLISAVDRAAEKGIIHKNTAARKVSRFTKLVNSRLPSEAA